MTPSLANVHKQLSLKNRILNGEFGLQKDELSVILNSPTASECLFLDLQQFDL